MERSLSILLPVMNAQSTLQHSVARLLDLASELTEKFEILIVDDGSTDHTEEIAHQLATIYPQVGVLRHQGSRGLVEVIRNGLPRTTGEIVCLHEGQGEIDVADLRELWKLRDEEDLVLARHERRQQRGQSGFHMLRRSAMGSLQGNLQLAAGSQQLRLRHDDQTSHAARPARPNFLAKLRNLALGE